MSCHRVNCRIVKETIELVDQEAIRVLDEATQTVGQPKRCIENENDVASYEVLSCFKHCFWMSMQQSIDSLDRHSKPQ